MIGLFDILCCGVVINVCVMCCEFICELVSVWELLKLQVI